MKNIRRDKKQPPFNSLEQIPPQPSLFQREGAKTHFEKGGRRSRGDLLLAPPSFEGGGWEGVNLTQELKLNVYFIRR